jgi:hypothetical protein
MHGTGEGWKFIASGVHETEAAWKIIAKFGGFSAFVCAMIGMVWAAIGSDASERTENMPKGFLAGAIVGALGGAAVTYGVIS